MPKNVAQHKTIPGVRNLVDAMTSATTLHPAGSSNDVEKVGMYSWEVLLEEGWRPYSGDISMKLTEALRKGEHEVEFSVKKEPYRVTFVDDFEAEQVNLSSYYTRPVRRSNLNADSQVPPPRWSQILSQQSLQFDESKTSVRSPYDPDSSKFAHSFTRVAYGSQLLHGGLHTVPIVYKEGVTAYLIAGIVQVNCTEMRNEESKLLNSWEKAGDSTHAGCYLYSFYYNRFSANGSDWEDFEGYEHGNKKDDPTATFLDRMWKTDDTLLINFDMPKGTLSFAFKAHDQEMPILLGIVATDLFVGQFRVCAFLGMPSQCLCIGLPADICRDSAVPPYIRQLAVKPVKKSKASSAVLSDTAARGISLKQLKELGETIQDVVGKHELVDSRGQRVTWEAMTMYQVSDLFVVPMTQAAVCSYVEFVATGSQAPQWMVSHAWSTCFANTLQMLTLHSVSRYAEHPLRTLYWICTMANNQHDLSELSEEDIMRSPFARVLTNSDCIGTVLLCDPSVTPMKRVWCVFEMHISESMRSGRLSVASKPTHFLDVVAIVLNGCDKGDAAAMLQDALDGNWHEITDIPDTYFPLEVARVGTQVDIARATASVTHDRNAILNYVASSKASTAQPPTTHSNYDALNSFIHSIFASAELYRLACERPEDCVKSITRLLGMRADANKFVRNGNTSLLAALGADPKNPVPASDEILKPILELLFTARADPNCVNSKNGTALDCAAALSGETKEFLRDHGAKHFREIASVHEKNVNAMIVGILSKGFTSESDAFGGSGGGGNGAKLLRGAERALQQVASILKRYPHAHCRIQVLATRIDRLAKRGTVVKGELQSAGCTNPFEVNRVDRGPLVSISVHFEENSQ